MTDVQLTNNHQAIGSLPASLSASPELFDSPLYWATSPVEAFASWISGQPVADSTRRVRSSMWNKFVRYLDSVGVGLAECEAHHVSGFIEQASPKEGQKEQGWRYVKLIERVYVHLNGIGLTQTNPARLAAQRGVEKKPNAPMHFLSKEERQKLNNYVRSVLLQAGEEAAGLKQNKEERKAEYATLWAVMRDATVAAVLVGAGVKIGELGWLSVNCTSDSGVLVVPRSGFDLERRVPLLQVAEEALKVWVPFREGESDLGRVLFPALITRRRDDQRTLTAAMHPATVFRRVKALLDAIGISGDRACGQTLRNTYAACLIESGLDDLAIIEALGFKGEFSVLHLRAEHEAFCNRPAAD